LEVSRPEDQVKVEDENIVVSGRADPESKVYINNQYIQIDSSGKFLQEIRLTESINKISVVAVSKNNKSTTVEKTVFLKE
jgi:HSP20 family molecular chaperone IbpA